MAKACNDLLKIRGVTGIDVPLNEPPETAWDRLKTWLTAQQEKSDILLLVDMGSLTNLGKMVESELQLRCRTITMVSTLHVLQAARKAAEGLPLDRVYRDVADIRDTFLGEPAVNPPVRYSKQNYIITLCSTGEGSALLVRDYLASHLKFDRTKILIRNLGISGQDDIRIRLKNLQESGVILFLVSPFPVDAGIPVFPIDEAMSTEGCRNMQKIIDSNNLFEKMEDAYREFLSLTDPGKVFPAARNFTEQIEQKTGFALKENVRTGIFCHIACMVDRLKKGQSVQPFSGMKQFIEERQQLVETVKYEAANFEKIFSIAIPDDEICYLASFFHPDNCINSEKDTERI
jgi:transcriptional regulatory protein LevR